MAFITSLSLFANADPVIPTWPKTYRLQGIWRIPFIDLKTPIEINTDMTNPNSFKQAVTQYGVTTKILITGDKETRTTINAQQKYDSIYCTKAVKSDKEVVITDYLPQDPEEWTYVGIEAVNGKLAYKWTKYFNTNRPDWFYSFYCDIETMTPLRYYMNGQSIAGSHPTQYMLDIEHYSIYVDQTVFIQPPGCILKDRSGGGPTEDNAYPFELPSDLSIPLKAQNEEQICDVVTNIPDVNAPEEFTWRERGVIKVLDQASCGSCWAQAAGGVLTSQLRLMGINDSVSIQSIVDCTWDHKQFDNETANHACDGGDCDVAYQEMINKHIPLISEDNYPYLGIGGACAPNGENIGAQNVLGYVSKCYQFIGNTNQSMKELMKKALYKYGPLVVYIIGSQTGFVELGKQTDYLYSSDQCNDNVQGVDHGVILTGYKKIGDTWAWEILNSWSDYWGDGGYGYIDMDDNRDCSIKTKVLVGLVNRPDY